MTASTVLPVILYILGAILLVTLIVLTVKLILLMNKIENTVDNITNKVKTLDGLFSIIETINGRFYKGIDKIVDGVALLIEKIFKRKEEDKNE